MKIRVKQITGVENRDFGKKKELEWGQARVDTRSVRVLSKEEAERMAIADILKPPEKATIEVYGDNEACAKWRNWVREQPEHELVGS